MGKESRSLKLREPNSLIEAKTKMSREEMVLWLYSILKVKAVDYRGREREVEALKRAKEPFKAVAKVNLKDLARYSVDEDNSKKIFDAFRYYRKILNKLIQKVVFEVDKESYKKALEFYGFDYLVDLYNLNNEDLKAIAIAVIDKIELWKDGAIVYFTEYVAPLIVEYKKWFTTYNLPEILELKSRTALILYRLFRKHLGLKLKQFKISIEKLKQVLNTPIKNKDFQSKLLIPAIKEINEKTSLKVEIEPIRRGRGGKIVGFRFRVEEEPRPEAATTKELVENLDVLKKWVRKTIEQLAKELSVQQEMRPIDLVNTLLSLQRVSPAVAIWVLLHFPSAEGKLYALEQIKWVDTNLKLGLPEKFLQHGIQVPKKEFQFLWDERVKHGVLTTLRELKKEMEKELLPEEKQQFHKVEQEIIDLTNPKYWLKKFLEEDPKPTRTSDWDDGDDFLDL